MRRIIVVFVLLCSMIPALRSGPVAASTPSCGDFDAWEWAQSVYDQDKDARASLDPDGNGVACDELPHGGFAPTLWTDKIPADAKPAQLLNIVDGDTFDFRIDGVSNRVRIYRADTPETQNQHDCGGEEATAFTTAALGYNDDAASNFYLEKDKTKVDKYGRELEYVWFTVAGKPYMLNELLIRSGWAEDEDYGDHLYDQQMKDAAAFAKKHEIGVYALCGKFGVPLSAAPTAVSNPSGPSVPASTDVPYVAPTDVPYVAPTDAPAPANSGCNPNYSPCVPNSPTDLDCGDIGFPVTVIGVDVYRLDRDGDGYGCESY